MRTFLALTGVKEAGKTTTFEMIKELVPTSIEVTLAKKLKDVCAEVFGVPRSYFDDQRFKEKELDELVHLNADNVQQVYQAYAAVFSAMGAKVDYDLHVRPHIGKVLESPRRVAQYVGTEVLRAVLPSVHCDAVSVGLPETGTFVLTDMRFPDEFDYFNTRMGQDFHGLYVQNHKAEAKLGPNSHPSEKYVLEIGKRCYKLDNNGTFEELKAQIFKYLSERTEVLDASR